MPNIQQNAQISNDRTRVRPPVRPQASTPRTLAGQLAALQPKPDPPPAARVVGPNPGMAPAASAGSKPLFTSAPPMRQTGAPANAKPAPAPRTAEKVRHVEPDETMWAASKRDGSMVAIQLLSGESFSGVVKSFGLYNLLLTVADGCEVLLLKSAIAWARKATTTTTAATGTTGGRP